MGAPLYILTVVMSLFFCGYWFLRVCMPSIGVIGACALSLHIGISIWAIVWVGLYMLGVEGGYGWQSDLNVYAAITFLLIALLLGAFFSLRVRKRDFAQKKRDAGHLVITTIAVLIVATYSILGYLFSTNLWIAGDSYYFIFWSADPAALLHNGFPLVNLSIAHLSTLVSPNYYLSQLFPLMAIGLSAFMADFVYRSVLADGLSNSESKEAVTLLVTLGFFIFVGNSMFMMNSTYLNHHLLSAGLFLLLGQIIWINTTIASIRAGHLLTVALLGITISVSRMEGFIFLVIFLATMVVFQKEKRAGLAALFAAGITSLPYIYWLAEMLNENSFVKAEHYTVMLLGYLCIVLVLVAGTALRLTPRVMIIAGWTLIFFGVLIAVYSKPEQMIVSLYYFTKNTLNPAYWGALVWLSIFGVVAVFYSRAKSGYGRLIWSQDAVLHAVGFCVGVIVLMTYFRTSLRYGETDSANRMLFHFLPLLWVVVQVEVIGRVKNSFSKDEPQR